MLRVAEDWEAEMVTLADEIRALLRKGLTPTQIADRLVLRDRKYPARIRWFDAHPGYSRDAMRKTRAKSDYREREAAARAEQRRRQRQREARSQ